MKSSLIRSFAIFAAGAATAALAANMDRLEPKSAGQLQEEAFVLLAKIEAFGAYVGTADKGRVGIYTHPVGACISPKPPVPVLPANAVDMRNFDLGVKGLQNILVGTLMGDEAPVFEIDKCRPVEEFKGFKN